MSVPQAADSYVYGDCTYGVALMHPDIPPDMGNAGDWIDGARRHGLTVVSQPIPGSIVSYRAGGRYTQFGHVASVEDAYPNGTFLVREMNYSAWNGWDERVSDMTDVQGFIIPPTLAVSGNYQLLAQTGGSCSTFSWNVFGQQICFDGAIGGAAIAGGLVIGVVGLVILVIFTFRKTAGGRAVVESAGAVQSTVQTVTPSRVPTSQQASQQRVATARGRAAMRAQHLQRKRESEPMRPLGEPRRSRTGVGSRGGKTR